MVNSRFRLVSCEFRRFRGFRLYPAPTGHIRPEVGNSGRFLPDFDSGAGIAENPESVFENPGQKPDQWLGAMVISHRAMVNPHRAMVISHRAMVISSASLVSCNRQDWAIPGTGRDASG